MRNLFGIGIGLFFLVSCSGKATQEDTQKTQEDVAMVHLTQQQFENGGFVVEEAKMEKIAAPLFVQAKVVALPEAGYSVAFPLRARPTQIMVKLGDVVKKGQTLMLVEDLGLIEVQQNYLTTLSDFTFAKLELERQKELQVTSATSKRNEQQAQANHDRLLALLKSYKEQLSLLGISAANLDANNLRKSVAIVAPMSGVVSSMQLVKGAYFESNQSLLEILDPSKTETHVQLFQTDLKNVKIGEEVQAKMDGKTMFGKIERIVPNLNSDNSGSAIVTWNKTENLMVGSVFQVQIMQNEKEAFTVPAEALLSWNAKKYVIVQRENLQFELLEVNKSIENGARVGIEGALQASDKVVVKNAYTLLMAMKNEDEE